jgi:UDP-glucose 4-epimerase
MEGLIRTILVTGANGFVGRAACRILSSRGYAVRRALRALPSGAPGNDDFVVLGNLEGVGDWGPVLTGIDAVLHLAGRSSALPGRATDAASNTVYRLGNVVGTQMLAQAAARAAVRRFVFVSSVKVNGEATHERPFRETDLPRPDGAYGRSKWEAEQLLHGIAARTALEIVIVRPPLVYGPGVQGNMARLLRAVDRGIPLPLGSIDNLRSLVGLGNLVDALHACIAHPRAAGETFLVSDCMDLSTTTLIRLLAEALERPARLLPVPAWMLRLAGRCTGSDALARLVGSLQVDPTHLVGKLGWRPPHSVHQEMEAMVRAYRSATSLPDPRI